MGNQPPMHEPAFVAALVADNDGNVRGSLGGDVKARGVLRQVAVKVPANPNLTEFERSCESATHNGSTYSAGLMKRQARLSIRDLHNSSRASLLLPCR
jgi:hypothetical protein